MDADLEAVKAGSRVFPLGKEGCGVKKKKSNNSSNRSTCGLVAKVYLVIIFARFLPLCVLTYLILTTKYEADLS